MKALLNFEHQNLASAAKVGIKRNTTSSNDVLFSESWL
jgi:hypothetical protein